MSYKQIGIYVLVAVVGIVLYKKVGFISNLVDKIPGIG